MNILSKITLVYVLLILIGCANTKPGTKPSQHAMVSQQDNKHVALQKTTAANPNKIRHNVLEPMLLDYEYAKRNTLFSPQKAETPPQNGPHRPESHWEKHVKEVKRDVARVNRINERRYMNLPPE